MGAVQAEVQTVIGLAKLPILRALHPRDPSFHAGAPISSAPQTPASIAPVRSPKQQFLDGFEREAAITLKVLKAYPDSQSELKPHEKLKTARELAAMFTMEMSIVDLTGKAAFMTWTEKDR